MVHFTNREISEEVSNVTSWKPEWQRSIVVGRNNIKAVTGPFLGRLLKSSGLYGIGLEGNKNHFLLSLELHPFTDR
jgi:hypothetical protein